MKKTLAVLGVVALGVAGIVGLTGFRGGCGSGHGHGRDPAAMAAFVTDRVDDTLDDLDATDAQRQQIHAVKDRMLQRAAGLRGSHREVHAQVLAQWNAAQPDAAALHALVDQRVDAMRALAHEAVDAGVEVHGILTPEQRARLAKKLERHAGDR